MTDKEKELLLKDLCARLPYGVNVQVYYEDMAGSGYFDETVWVIDNDKPFHINDRRIEDIKPYLRPLSSMTEEEEKEYAKIVVKSQDCSYANNESATTMVNDWYLSKGFDVRGLIPKGLALEAPDGMYK